MKTTAKISTQFILIAGILLISVLFANTSLYADPVTQHKKAKSNREKIADRIDKIKNYMELLKTVEEKKTETIEWRIDLAQERIHELMDESELNEHHTTNLPFTVYEFDAADESLILDDFNADRSGSLTSFHLNFNTPESNGAKVDIISPGGELLQSITRPNFHGSFDEEISLSSEKGKIYFVHIDVNGKSTTKKLTFK